MPKDAHKCAFLFNEITRYVRDYAANLGVSEEETLKKGLEHKAVEFKKAGAQI